MTDNNLKSLSVNHANTNRTRKASPKPKDRGKKKKIKVEITELRRCWAKQIRKDIGEQGKKNRRPSRREHNRTFGRSTTLIGPQAKFNAFTVQQHWTLSYNAHRTLEESPVIKNQRELYKSRGQKSTENSMWIFWHKKKEETWDIFMWVAGVWGNLHGHCHVETLFSKVSPSSSMSSDRS